MYKKILVNGDGELIADGEKLINKLEDKQFPISAAFMRYPDEEHAPRLVIVSPDVGQKGPLDTYGYILKAVDELGDTVHFGLSDISVMSPSWSQFQELLAAIQRAGVKPGEKRVDVGDYYLFRWDPDKGRSLKG